MLATAVRLKTLHTALLVVWQRGSSGRGVSAVSRLLPSYPCGRGQGWGVECPFSVFEVSPPAVSGVVWLVPGQMEVSCLGGGRGLNRWYLVCPEHPRYRQDSRELWPKLCISWCFPNAVLGTFQLFHYCEAVKCFTAGNVWHLMSKWLLLLPRWRKELTTMRSCHCFDLFAGLSIQVVLGPEFLSLSCSDHEEQQKTLLQLCD